jgi:hypothetical protein
MAINAGLASQVTQHKASGRIVGIAADGEDVITRRE